MSDEITSRNEGGEARYVVVCLVVLYTCLQPDDLALDVASGDERVADSRADLRR